MPQQPTEIIDLTFLGTDNHRTTHSHLLTLAYRNLIAILKDKQKDLKENQQVKSVSEIADDEDTLFIHNSSIQMRLFDGIGCKGTKDHPRPGNYTWDNQFTKTERQPNEIISHHLAKATGEGMQALIQEADAYIDFIIKENNKGTLPKTMNLKGYSRGADACIRLTNRIYEKYPQIKINMFLVDPVPGPFHRDDDGSYIIPGNVERLDVTFMKDEKIRFYKPQHMGRLVIQNPLTTKVTEHYLAGVHGEALYIDLGIPAEYQKTQSHMETQQNLRQFILDTTHQKINLPKCYRDRKKPAQAQFKSETSISSNPNSNKAQKSYFPSLITLFHQKRTLVQQKHDEFAKEYQSTQSEELQFYMKQFRDAQHFYHYHFPYHQKQKTTFETLIDALARIKEIFLGKTMEEKTKLWPDHYATLLMQEALTYNPEYQLASHLEGDEDFKNKLSLFIEKLQSNLSSDDQKQILEKETYKKYQLAKEKHLALKNKNEDDPIDTYLLTQPNINIPNDDMRELEKWISQKTDEFRIQKFKKVLEIIQAKLPNSKFYKNNLQSYEQYQNDFIAQVENELQPADRNESGQCTREQKFKIAQFYLKQSIQNTQDKDKLHQLYAIGQPGYLKDLLPQLQKILKKSLGPGH